MYGIINVGPRLFSSFLCAECRTFVIILITERTPPSIMLTGQRRAPF
jgi:hypothetical protein